MLRKLMKEAPLVLYIFYVVYTPTFSSNVFASKFVILTVLAGILLIPYVLTRDRGVWDLLSKPPVMTLMLAVFFGSLYLMVVKVVNGEASDTLDDLRVVQNNVANLMILNVAIILDQLKKRGFSKRQSFEVLLWLGSFQGVFSIAGLFIPWIREISYSLYAVSGADNVFVLESRIFGFTGEFTYGTPIYHGILAGTAFYYLVRNRSNYVVHIVLILITAGMNGRTGLVAFGAMSIITIVILYGKRGNLLGMVAVFLATLGIASIGISLLRDISPTTYKFIISFIDDSTNLLFEGTATGNYGVLLDGLWRVPDGLGLIFGTGERAYTGEPGFRSDVGFTNDLYAGGLVFVLLLYLALVGLLLRSSHGRFLLGIELVVVFFLANFKGEVFHSSVILFVFVFLALLSLRDDEDAPELSEGKNVRKYVGR